MQRYIVTVEGPNFSDVEKIELPRLPAEGDPIETRYGTAYVTAVEDLPGGESFDGKIVCRLP